MQGFIEKVKELYEPSEPVETLKDGTVIIYCDAVTERLDHYVCGDEDCNCHSYEAEGHCEAAWQVECVDPVIEEFSELKHRYFSLLKTEENNDENETFQVSASVCDKGSLIVTVNPCPNKEAEPEKKRQKMGGDDKT